MSVSVAFICPLSFFFRRRDRAFFPVAPLDWAQGPWCGQHEAGSLDLTQPRRPPRGPGGSETRWCDVSEPSTFHLLSGPRRGQPGETKQGSAGHCKPLPGRTSTQRHVRPSGNTAQQWGHLPRPLCTWGTVRRRSAALGYRLDEWTCPGTKGRRVCLQEKYSGCLATGNDRKRRKRRGLHRG